MLSMLRLIATPLMPFDDAAAAAADMIFRR